MIYLIYMVSCVIFSSARR